MVETQRAGSRTAGDHFAVPDNTGNAGSGEGLRRHGQLLREALPPQAREGLQVEAHRQLRHPHGPRPDPHVQRKGGEPTGLRSFLSTNFQENFPSRVRSTSCPSELHASCRGRGTGSSSKFSTTQPISTSRSVLELEKGSDPERTQS